jgi:hypothetical protein
MTTAQAGTLVAAALLVATADALHAEEAPEVGRTP